MTLHRCGPRSILQLRRSPPRSPRVRTATAKHVSHFLFYGLENQWTTKYNIVGLWKLWGHLSCEGLVEQINGQTLEWHSTGVLPFHSLRYVKYLSIGWFFIIKTDTLSCFWQCWDIALSSRPFGLELTCTTILFWKLYIWHSCRLWIGEVWSIALIGTARPSELLQRVDNQSLCGWLNSFLAASCAGAVVSRALFSAM